MDIVLLRPLWLLALPPLVLAAVLLRRRRVRLGDWDRVVDPAIMAALRALGRAENSGGGFPGVAALSAAAVVIVALAGPAVERRDAAAYRNLDGVVFVLDVSPSMTESDDWIAIQTMARVGVAALRSRPAALIVFGGDAYMATDMTADTRQLGLTLSLLGAGTVPDPGSRPGLGLGLAERALNRAQILAGDVVLLTDGGGLGPAALQQAAVIAGHGARVSVVAPQRTAATETLASTGGGQVFALDQSADLAGFLARSGQTRLEKQDYPLLFRADYGRYLLGLALILVLPLFRRQPA